MRDVNQYTEVYSKDDFEQYQEYYRFKTLEKFLIEKCPKNILDIGVGPNPFFTFIDETLYSEYVCVEPAVKYFENAKRLSENNKKIKLIYSFFDNDSINKLPKLDYDFIICSGLLHELENPEIVLQAINKACNKDTEIFVDVPNAKSMHRILAKSMGLIKDEYQITDRNIVLQQHRIFDTESLKNLVEKNGFIVKKFGTYLIRLFTYDQMYKMLKSNIIDEKIIKGLYDLSSEFPENGSEIYMILKKKF